MSKYIDTENRSPIWVFRGFKGKEFPIYELEDHEITQLRLQRVQTALNNINRGWSQEMWSSNLKELEIGYKAYNDFASAKQFEQAIISITKNVLGSEDFAIINNLLENKATPAEITRLKTKLKSVPSSEELLAANLMLKSYAANKSKNENIAKLGLKLIGECIKRNEIDFVAFSPEYDLICTLFVFANERIDEPNEQLQGLKKQLLYSDTEGVLELKKKAEPKLLKHSGILVDYFPNVFQIILQMAQEETIMEIFRT